jgi:hypothetical protein
VQARRRGKRGARHFRSSGAHGLKGRRQSLQAVLDSQTLAALGAASVDDSAATTGFHADAKTVRARAAGDGWLVGTFHDVWPNKERKSLGYSRKALHFIKKREVSQMFTVKMRNRPATACG